MESSAQTKTGRLERLRSFLDQDPDNLSLLADAIEAAVDEGSLDTAIDLIGRYEAAAALPPQLQNLKGLAALGRGDFAEAATVFERLATDSPDTPAVRFNVAWAKTMLKDYEGALEALDDEVASSVPNAATLKVHTLHHLGRLEDALAYGAGLAESHADDTALMGALATAAMDAEDMELTRHYASRAGDHHEGLAVTGMLMLDESDITGATELFDRVLIVDPDNPRATIGKGLALLAQQRHGDAAQWLDKGAEAFTTHLGTWIASAWAYFVQGDLATSRQRFQTALDVDDTFAETHGSLAVLDVVENDIESAKRRIEVALRLDRNCFAAALAKSLLVAADGRPAVAERIQQTALNTPIGPGGKTIAQVMAAMAGRGHLG